MKPLLMAAIWKFLKAGIYGPPTLSTQPDLPASLLACLAWSHRRTLQASATCHPYFRHGSERMGFELLMEQELTATVLTSCLRLRGGASTRRVLPREGMRHPCRPT